MTDFRERMQDAFRLNLEQQKNRAKDLLRAAKAGDAPSLARIAAVRSMASDSARKSTLKLAGAQFVIARELGFPSWAQLKTHITAMELERAAIARQQPPDRDLKTLHIRCGSDIQSTLADAGFIGDFAEHSNPYCQGPVTNAPDRIEQRARFVTEAYGKYMGFTFEQALARRRAEEHQLAQSADDYERVVLWMEHDSFDQLVLLRCLAHYATAKKPRILELVSVNHFPGSTRFIGLGQLPAEALRLLWARRQPVTPAQLELGSEAWHALTLDDPRPLAALMHTGTPCLPHLAPALHRHLRELPSTANGLSLTQHLALTILSEGTVKMGRLLGLSMGVREPLPWLGDLMLLHIVEQMEAVAENVFIRSRGGQDEPTRDHPLSITDVGRAVLRGERDWLSLQPPPRWVGGVAIRPNAPCWRWNEAKREAVVA